MVKNPLIRLFLGGVALGGYPSIPMIETNFDVVDFFRHFQKNMTNEYTVHTQAQKILP